MQNEQTDDSHGGSGCGIASIAIDGVRRQWPWSNNVDVTYTVIDGDGSLDARVGRVRIKSVVNGGEHVAYDGISSPGQHTVTWANPPKGVKCGDCKMSARTAQCEDGDGLRCSHRADARDRLPRRRAHLEAGPCGGLQPFQPAASCASPSRRSAASRTAASRWSPTAPPGT